MRVKWTNEFVPNITDMGDLPDDLSDWDNTYCGEVIGTSSGLLGTYLVVACDDKQVREIEIEKVEIL